MPTKAMNHPNYSGGRDRRIVVPDQKKKQDPISKNNLGIMGHSCNPSYLGEMRISAQNWPRQN
jgi:hypothetical protein